MGDPTSAPVMLAEEGTTSRPTRAVVRRNSTSSFVSDPVLSILGTLFWPPSLPRCRIHDSKLPGLAEMTAGGDRPSPGPRWAR